MTSHFVYLIGTKSNYKFITYVGYTNNIEKRINLHNNSKGAKFTKGRTWFLVCKKSYKSKSIALREEYKLKKNYYLRNKLLKKYLIYEKVFNF